ncbi:MAG: DUF1826 domain-containing protein [Myxococcota bacterium]
MVLPSLQRTSVKAPVSRWSEVLRREINVLVIRRPLAAELAAALDAVANGAEFVHSATLDTHAPNPDELLLSVHDPVARAYLRTDIAMLTRQMGLLLSRRHVHARLSIERDDGCRRFHSDHVSLRMLCTYAGPGTEWCMESDVDRVALARTDLQIDTCNRLIVPNGPRHCAPAEVILLKGETFPGNRGRGAIHRSPPVEYAGLSRLVFKVDENPCGC